MLEIETMTSVARRWERCVVLTLLCLSCGNRVVSEGSQCFTVDQWEDERDEANAYTDSEEFRIDVYENMLSSIGFCEYGPDEKSNIFPGETNAAIDFVAYCEFSETCELCVGEEMDDGLVDQYRWWQDMIECPLDQREVRAYERGCMTEGYDDDGRYRCCYTAAIVSDCPVGLDFYGR